MKKSLLAYFRRVRAESAPLIVWWVQEVRDLGESLLGRVAPRFSTRTIIRLDRVGGTVSQSNGSKARASFAFRVNAAGEWPEDLRPHGDAEAIRGTRTVLVVSPDIVLTQDLSLPATVERELDRVVELHLERELPLPLNRVCVQRRVVARSGDGRKISVQILAIRRDQIEHLRELAKSWSVRIIRIAAAEQGVPFERAPLVGNFLPGRLSSERWKPTQPERRLAASAAVLAFAFVAVTAWQWGYERNRVNREIAHSSSRATQIRTLARQLESDSAPAVRLVSLMKQPDAFDVLVALTQSVPQDAWIFDLEVSARDSQPPQIKLSGFAPAATTLVDVLNRSQRFEKVRLVSASMAGLGSAQDRVQITGQWLIAPLSGAGP